MSLDKSCHSSPPYRERGLLTHSLKRNPKVILRREVVTQTDFHRLFQLIKELGGELKKDDEDDISSYEFHLVIPSGVTNIKPSVNLMHYNHSGMIIFTYSIQGVSVENSHIATNEFHTIVDLIESQIDKCIKDENYVPVGNFKQAILMNSEML